jgi:5-methylcytosine-specific restriction endonuclease McrA
MTTAKRNLKEQVLAQRQEGKTLQQIRRILGCSLSTIAYHIYGRTKKSTKKRTYRRRKLVGRFDNKTQNGILYRKYYQFFRLGKWRKLVLPPAFTFQELLDALPEKPVCYITGEPLCYSDSGSYSFDHATPTSRGGSNDLSNLKLASAKANRAKSDMTEAELIEFCKQVLLHHGHVVD